MKVLIACKRGNIAERDKWGHCLCKDCKSYRNSVHYANRSPEYQKNWRSKNKDKIKKYTKKWIENNPDKRRAIVASWRSRNPDKVKAVNFRSGKKWSKNNCGKRNAITAKRRTALLQRIPKWADLEKIKYVYLEAELLTKTSGIPYEVDHIVPLQGEFVSGLHVYENLQVIPKSLNRSKKNKMGDFI